MRNIHLQVLRTFADAQQLAGGKDGGVHAIFAPPWKDRLPNNKLGPEYSAVSPVTGAPVRFDQAWQEYQEGRYAFSAGLWDHEEEAKMSCEPSKKERRAAQREDAAEVAAYLARRSALVPRRELDVYMAFWVEGRSYAATARLLGLAVNTVRDLVKKLRIRVRK